MSVVVGFDGVSKCYRLGRSRTSLPTIVREAFLAALGPARARKSAVESIWALRDVSFELRRGDSLALVGPNGAGKSTLLKLLSRVTAPTDGRITVAGRVSALIELGAGFHPDLTGRENVYLNGTILGLSRQDITRRFDEIVSFSGLERFIDTPIKRYSSGMEVRLGFAVAAAMDPEILLVDEVLAVGDTMFRERCLARIRSLIEAGTSVIFVSHNLYLAQAVCQSALYLQGGRIKELGDVVSVIQAYERDAHKERAETFEAARHGETPDTPRDAGVVLTDVTVDGHFVAGTDALDAAMPASIAIRYHAVTDVPRVNLAVFLIRSDGVTCWMARTQSAGVELPVASGYGTVQLSLESLQLVSGSFFVEVELTNSSDSMVMTPTPARSGWFSVMGRTRSYDSRSGVFEPRARWHHTPGVPLEPSLPASSGRAAD